MTPRMMGSFLAWFVSGIYSLIYIEKTLKTFYFIKWHVLIAIIISSLYFYYVSIAATSLKPTDNSIVKKRITWHLIVIQDCLFLSIWPVLQFSYEYYPCVIAGLHFTYLVWDGMYKDFLFNNYIVQAKFLIAIDFAGFIISVLLIPIFLNLKTSSDPQQSFLLGMPLNGLATDCTLLLTIISGIGLVGSIIFFKYNPILMLNYDNQPV